MNEVKLSRIRCTFCKYAILDEPQEMADYWMSWCMKGAHHENCPEKGGE